MRAISRLHFVEAFMSKSLTLQGYPLGVYCTVHSAITIVRFLEFGLLLHLDEALLEQINFLFVRCAPSLSV
jgi:hypothetical protein